VAGTVQLEGGVSVAIPLDLAERADVTVENERGGILHLDLSGWTGADFTGTVTGQGSISLDGDTFTALDFAQTDLELADPSAGLVLHVNTLEVQRAGQELVTFGQTANPFDLLLGAADDLRNDQGLDAEQLFARLSQRLLDLDRIHDDLLLGIGVLGSRSARLANAGARADEVALELAQRLSLVEDADLAEVATDLARSQQVLQIAQAAGAQVIQTTLLDFLR
jgi:flagellin-like hook-associated protein FlgL